MNELVIWFYELLVMMIKHPESKRTLNWQIIFFERTVRGLDRHSAIYPFAVQMVEEIALCKRRRQTRSMFYNVSNMDEVCTQYRIHASPVALDRAWDMFYRNGYRLEGCV